MAQQNGDKDTIQAQSAGSGGSSGHAAQSADSARTAKKAQQKSSSTSTGALKSEAIAKAKPVVKDSALLSIQLRDSASAFRFKDVETTWSTRKTNEVESTPVATRSLFSPHELQAGRLDALTLNRDNPVWIFLLLFLMVAAFTWIKVFYARTMRQILQAVASMGAANQMLREENLLLQRSSVLLTVLFNLVAAFFLYQVSNYLEWSSDYLGSGFGRFLILAFVVSLAYSLKYLILRFTGHLFRTDKPLSVYIFHIFLINNALGMLLMPLVIAIAFLEPMYAQYCFYAAASLVALGFAYRLLRGLWIGLSFGEFSKFYLLLYLCTLEIGPLLITIKWLFL